MSHRIQSVQRQVSGTPAPGRLPGPPRDPDADGGAASDLARELRLHAGRIVVDKTGLSEVFDVDLLVRTDQCSFHYRNSASGAPTDTASAWKTA